jgi:hypothetical protein
VSEESPGADRLDWQNFCLGGATHAKLIVLAALEGSIADRLRELYGIGVDYTRTAHVNSSKRAICPKS